MGRFFELMLGFTLLSLPLVMLHAQTGEIVKDTSIYLPNDDVEVIKSFKARLANANRINWQTDQLKFEKKTINYDYTTSVRKLDIKYLPPKIRPITLYPEQPKKTYNNYFRVAYGYPNVWLGNLSFSASLRKKAKIGIRYSGQGNHAKKHKLQNFHWNDVNVFGSVKLSNNMEFHVGVEYQNDYRTFKYLFDSLLSQSMNKYGFHARVATPIDEDKPLKYYVMSSYHRSTLSLYNYKENFLEFGGGLFYTYKNIKTNFTSSSFALRSNNDTNKGYITQNELGFSYVHQRNKYKIGVNYLYSKTIGHKFLPLFDVSLRLYEELLFVRLRGKNEVGINSVRGLYDQNPYIAYFQKDNQVDYYFQEYTITMYGKVGQLHYSLAGGYALYKNVPFYKVQLAYKDTVTHTIFNENGKAPFVRYKLDYVFSESVEIGLKGEHYFAFSKSDLRFSEWLNTNFELKMKIYLSKKRLVVEPSFRLSTVKTNVFEEKTQRILPELGFLASYQITEKISGFLQGNNLLNSHAERFYGHPMVGTSVLIGMRCKW